MFPTCTKQPVAKTNFLLYRTESNELDVYEEGASENKYIQACMLFIAIT